MRSLVSAGFTLFLTAMLMRPVCLSSAGAATPAFERLTGVTLVANPYNDGDSFRVRTAEGEELMLRLYFVDGPETAAATQADARRLREQMRYFGLPDAARTLQFGERAKAFTAEMLAQPFTVHTVRARALGRSADPRLYAFVTTQAGDDLGVLLVTNGLARARGIGRATPAGESRDEHAARLQDMEAAAMLRRIGAWAESDPERIVELRAEQRREDQELGLFRTGQEDGGSGIVDVNNASAAELQTLPGIGPALAPRIIAARPFRTIEDLGRVPGIGPVILANLRERVSVGPEAAGR